MDNYGSVLQSLEIAKDAAMCSNSITDLVINSYEKILIDNSIYEYNREFYDAILNRVTFMTMIKKLKAVDLIKYKVMNGAINKIKSSDESGDPVKKIYGDLKGALKTKFNIDISDISKWEPVSKYEGYELLSEDSEDTEEIDFDIDESIDDFWDDELPNEADEEETIEEIGETEEDKTLKDKKDLVPLGYQGEIDSATEVILDRLRGLYAGGFAAMPQVGILINNKNAPIVYVNGSGEEKSLSDKYVMNDIMILNAVLKNVPVCSLIYDGEDIIPSIDYMMANQAVLYKLHLQFQSASYKYCTGNTSIRRWITETKDTKADDWLKDNAGSGGRLKDFKQVEQWYKWVVENIMYDTLIEKGLTDSDNLDVAKVRLLTNAISNTISRVIVVKERNVVRDDKGETKGLENIDIEICIGNEINHNEIKAGLERELNISGSNAVEVKMIAADKYNKYKVLTLSIIMNKKLAGKSDLFAYSVVDNLLSSGNRPTWSHALLGKSEDGTYMFWDNFQGAAMPEKRCYSIYAASRSGKGVMTSTLVASAICDGIMTNYTDGKPENGVTLGEIAWREGKEAYVFDGMAEGKQPYGGFMEQYTYGLRQQSDVTQYMTVEAGMPSELFENKNYFTNQKQQVFLGVMRYLKSLSLCASIIEARAKGGDSGLSSEQWALWVFDEMTAMSSNEKEIRKIFSRYVRDKRNKTAKGDSEYVIPDIKMEEASEDAGLAYIKSWKEWTERIQHLFLQAAVISIGKARMNLLFIFQEASWILTDKKITTIGKVVSLLKTTKIVGRGGLVDACKEYGTKPVMDTAWYKKVNTDGGWWGISDASDLRNANVHVFKPYKVWTTPLIQGTDNKDPNGDIDSPKYVYGYVKKLTEPFGINAADVLNSAFVYSDEAVQKLGLGDNLYNYMYNPCNFSSGDIKVSFDDLRQIYANDNTDDDGDKTVKEKSISSDGEHITNMTLIRKLAGLDEEILKEYADIIFPKAEGMILRKGDLNVDDDKRFKFDIMAINNYHYLGNKLGLDMSRVYDYCQADIEKVKNKIIFGILMALNDKTLEYDEIPKKEWIDNLIKTDVPEFEYNPPENNFDISEDDIERNLNNQGQFTEKQIKDFTSRVLKMMMRVKRVMGLTDEQAESVADTYIERMSINE